MNCDPIEVRYRRGVHLPEVDLWLDPDGSREAAFVSHAHSDHFARHGTILCSTQTRDLIVARYGTGSADVIALDYHEEAEYRGWKIKLLPAGHIFGSAQIHLTRPADGASLLFTGDFKTRPGLSCEAARFEEADTFVMETTFGQPKYVFPPTEEVIAEVLKFAKEAVEEGEVPIMLGYSLGKAQEILSAFLGAGLPVMLHKTVLKMTKIYERFAPEFPEYEEFDPARVDGHILIAPPNAARSQQVRRLKNARLAMLSGWALNSGAKFRYQVDEVFPLSDHADYPGLMEAVEAVKPSRVYTLHGFAEDFARDLREMGYDAWSLLGDNQMELMLSAHGGNSAPPAGESPEEAESSDNRESGDQFGRFVDACEQIAGTTGKLKKTQILADYLRDLSGDDLPVAATFLTGHAFEQAQENRALQLGWRIIRRSVLEVSGLSEGDYRKLTQGQNDMGRAATLALAEGKAGLSPRPHSFPDMRALFRELREASGPVEKGSVLSGALRGFDPKDGQYVVKILTGDLRIGLKEGLLEESVAAAFEADPSLVREASMLLGSIGKAVVLARENRLEEAEIEAFTPVKVMLASPEETAEAVVARASRSWASREIRTDGPDPADEGSPAAVVAESPGEGERGDHSDRAAPARIWLEDKFDGIRAQLHRRGDRAELFSRDLRPMTAEFPELIRAAVALSDDVILDGEIIAFAEGKKLTFFDLQKRLGRRNESDLFLGPAVPVRFVVFDLLWLNGQSTLKFPLHERRALLERIVMPDQFELASVKYSASPEEVEFAFKAARKRDNEGVIAKDASSLYTPGRRGKSWLKLKKAFSSLDCVVVAAEQGHGKRAHVVSDYTFAVRDEESGELRIIGKAYSGLTDAEIEELTEHFTENTIEKHRQKRIVTPDIVLEIAFDSIQPSKRHNSGLSLRFPRIVAIRRDKTAEDIDTLAYARQLAGVGA